MKKGFLSVAIILGVLTALPVFASEVVVTMNLVSE